MPTIRERGTGFQAIVRVHKNGVLVFQQSRMFPTRRLAADWGTRLEEDVKKNGPPDTRLSELTLAHLMREHLRVMEDSGSVRRTKAAEQYLVSTYFEADTLESLHPSTFARFAAKRRAAGAGPVTIAHNLSLVRATLAAAPALFGLDVGVQSVASACDTLRRTGALAKSVGRTRRLLPGEMEKLCAEFERIQGHPSTVIPMHTIIMLAVQLPRRRGELMRALWRDYDAQKRTLTLRGTKSPRAPRTEVIPVPLGAARILDGLERTDARILPYEEESVSAAFQRACKRLGIEDLRFHDLRHEGISRLFEEGHAIQEVALVSGHLSWQMLRRYTHLDAQNVAAKMNKEP